MAKKQILRLNLSEHTLDIRYNRSSWENSPLDLDEIDEYLRALVTDKDGFREYQYKAIQDILFYLWADKYNSVKDLAKENWRAPDNSTIQQRFSSEDNFLRMLPLPDKLSGGKNSYRSTMRPPHLERCGLGRRSCFGCSGSNSTLKGGVFSGLPDIK